MSIPEWPMPGLAGAAAGGVAGAIFSFSTLGWMTGSQGGTLAQKVAGKRVMATMVPVCVHRAHTDPARMAHLSIIQQATGTGTGKRDAAMATGWATVPGSARPERARAVACLTALDLSVS